MNDRTETLALLWSGLLLAGGAAFFLWGGSQHPNAGSGLGGPGSEGYWEAFVAAVVAHHGWGSAHARILAGPLFWALGTVGLVTVARRRGAAFTGSFGFAALALGAACWAVAFAFDGWTAPIYARSYADATEPLLRAGAMLGFQANQELVIRLGLVSWLLISIGTAGVGASVVAAGIGSRSARWVVAVTGVALGLWSTVAWATGEFRPGPFTSGLWMATAGLTGLWYAALGALVALSARRAARPV